MDIRLAVVDGHTLIRYGLRELAAQNPEIQIVAECSSMANAWSVLQAVQPHVVTADVTLPDGDGMQLARQLRDLRNDLGIESPDGRSTPLHDHTQQYHGFGYFEQI